MTTSPRDPNARDEERRRAPYWRIVGAVVVLATVALGVAFASSLRRGRRPDPADLPAHSFVEEGGLRYEYDALLNRESLYISGDCETDLAPSRPADVQRMRGKLLERLGVDELEVIREAHEDAAAALKRNGYL